MQQLDVSLVQSQATLLRLTSEQENFSKSHETKLETLKIAAQDVSRLYLETPYLVPRPSHR